MNDRDPKDRARELFLTEANTYGCAETALMVLQEHFSLPDPEDFSPAMALNGEIGYSGGMCGAITGAALIAGRLGERGVLDHAQAKREARRLTQDLIAAFSQEFGSVNCRSLTGYDFQEPGQHQAFIDSGIWRESCLHQIEFAVDLMRRLAESTPWATGGPGHGQDTEDVRPEPVPCRGQWGAGVPQSTYAAARQPDRAALTLSAQVRAPKDDPALKARASFS